VFLLHDTPSYSGGRITGLTVAVRYLDGRVYQLPSIRLSICPLPDSTQKLRSAWNDRGQRRFFGRKFSSRDFHLEDPLGAPRWRGLPPLRFRPTPDRRRECSDLLLTVSLCSRE
jgi:hypothetical protein